MITNSSASPAILQSQAGATDGGTFSGRIDEGSGGPITFNKSGGILTMSGNNNYSGGTVFVIGGAQATRWIILGGNNVLGTGPITFGQTSTLTSDANPRSVNNSIFLQSSSSFGSAGAGLLTCSGPVTLQSGVDSTFTYPSDVVFSGPLTSDPFYKGGFQIKDGAGTLRLLNNTFALVQVANDMRINDGSIIVDAATVTLRGPDNTVLPNFRVQSQLTNGLASLFITNSGSLSVGNSSFGFGRLRIGDTSSPTNVLGKPVSTNIVDIRGTLIADGVTLGYSGSAITTNNPGPSEIYVTNWNSGGAYARLSLQAGSQVTLNQISSSPSKTIKEVYLNGATINAFDGAASSFLQGMTNVFIQSGGLTINGQNTNSIHIRQNLLEGSPGGGGLTWNGTNDGNGLAGWGVGDAPQACMLQLDGTNTYTGTTLINVGILGGIGTLSSPVVFAGGTLLYPGGGGTIGKLTVNSTVTMNPGVKCLFELNTTNAIYQTNEVGVVTNTIPLATNDMLVVSGALSINNATLSVNNNGPTNVLGDYFKLFSQPVASGSFTNISLPGLTAGLAWANNLAADGSISVVVAVVTPPKLEVSQAGNVLNFSWVNGTGSFHLQSQTNSLSVGLVTNSTSWLNYPGGGTSPVGVTIDPVNPTVFFRLSQ